VDFAYFALDPVPAPPVADGQARLITFSDFQSFEKHQGEVSGFIVGTEDRQVGENLLVQLRHAPFSAAKPVFLTRSLGLPADLLADGVIETVGEAALKAAPILKRLADIDPKIFDESESRVFSLLTFLYARPESEIIPSRHWTNEHLYQYPLPAAMLGENDTIHSWLRNLIDRNLIREVALVDRVRHCPNCNGAHLNFIDICPECQNIDIFRSPFLHCFTCGNVAPENDYLKEGVLACLNCHTRLRHIGVDYDRALENYQCRNCRNIFADPDVMAQCQHCGNQNVPDELIPRKICRFAITEQGIMSARSGLLDDMFALLDTLNNVRPAYFESLLDWLLLLCARYPEENFGLVGLRIHNVVELTEKIGRRRVVELIDGFAGRLRELIRGTDLSTRTTRQIFWLLLPKTDFEGCNTVLERIREIRALTRQDEGVALEFSTTAFSAPLEQQESEMARLLLGRLEGSLF
jgi:GGDEF domain-containing protein